MSEVKRFAMFGPHLEEAGGQFVYASDFDKQAQEIERLKLLSVENILLDIAPGDGSGIEVYAKSISDVEKVLCGLVDKIEALEAELSQLKSRQSGDERGHDTKGSRKAMGAMNAKLRAKAGRLERELAALSAPSHSEQVRGKYAEVLNPFVAMMENELHANAGKGDRPGWLKMDRKTALLEIYYHLGKLQKAAKDDDLTGIIEYAADVANMSMMLVDVCGLLPATPPSIQAPDLVPDGEVWMIPTVKQLEQALESVPSFHDLSAELIAPAMLEHLRDVITTGEYGDPYQGAREELAIWKRRALESETRVREQDKIIENLGDALNDESGPTFMGEPVLKPAAPPSIPETSVVVERELLERIEQSWRVPDGCPRNLHDEVDSLIKDGLHKIRAILSSKGGAE